MQSKKDEIKAIANIDEMGIQSLAPNIDDMWQQVKWSLIVTRNLDFEPAQKDLDDLIRVFIESREMQPYKWKFESSSLTFINEHIRPFISHFGEEQSESIASMNSRMSAIAVILWSPACQKYLNAKFYI